MLDKTSSIILAILPKKKVHHSGFTLAEVLITLTIIGVIAALTIPNLMAKHEKQVTVTKLKKVYSTLSQAIDTSISENGPIESWNRAGYSDSIDVKYEFLKKYLFNYLKIAKNCHKDTRYDCSKFLQYRQGYWSYEPYANTVVLEDGTLLFVKWFNIIDVYEFSILVDINHDAPPNTIGKDLFVFNVNDKKKFHAAGIDWSRERLMGTGSYACNPAAAASGGDRRYCAALIIKDGWQIKDDYPAW